MATDGQIWPASESQNAMDGRAGRFEVPLGWTAVVNDQASSDEIMRIFNELTKSTTPGMEKFGDPELVDSNSERFPNDSMEIGRDDAKVYHSMMMADKGADAANEMYRDDRPETAQKVKWEMDRMSDKDRESFKKGLNDDLARTQFEINNLKEPMRSEYQMRLNDRLKKMKDAGILTPEDEKKIKEDVQFMSAHPESYLQDKEHWQREFRLQCKFGLR